MAAAIYPSGGIAVCGYARTENTPTAVRAIDLIAQQLH
jgi:hypothetical protein